MTDQLGQFCPEHSPAGITCFCDEERDRAAWVHRASGVGNMFGGHNCVCGSPWLDKYNCCVAGRADEVSSEKAVQFLEELLRQALQLRRRNRQLRMGQAYVHALGELQPSWAGLLIGELFDPYFDDGRVLEFLKWVQAVAARLTICSAHRLWEPACLQCQVPGV